MMNNNISFGYKSPIKKIAKHCAYTAKSFSESEPATFEHIIPHCKANSSNGIENCLAVTKDINHTRGSMPFNKWLNLFPVTRENIQAYLDEMRGTIVNGKDYVESVKETLNKEAKGVTIFKGKCQPLRKEKKVSNEFV